MELWDVYDKDRNLTGKTMERDSGYIEGEYHLIVHICVFNSEGKMLIQQRQPFKKGWSGLWDVTVGGSSVAGETSRQSAERELAEEIGLSLDFSDKRPSITVDFEHGFDDYYLFNKDIDISQLKLQYEEVKQVKWATMEEILDMIDDKIFIPYYKSFIETLFEMKKYLGARKK